LAFFRAAAAIVPIERLLFLCTRYSHRNGIVRKRYRALSVRVWIS
jgi:hypothetical protein